MKVQHNKSFIFWLIGLGCGMVLSGIIMLALILGTKEYGQQMANQFSEQQVQKTEGSLSATQADEESTEPIETKQENQNSEVDIPNEKEVEYIEEGGEQAVQSVDKVIYIPEKLTALQICIILEKEGIIQDAKDFSAYLVKNKKTTYLKDGTISLPTNATYEELTKRLLIK
ncbi:MAG: aminodeoxychorismate lyase [Clostridia bacterium]|jgi:hypothetical protein|nr:aminodeoxychorismate lyase [Clostridia bacterium]